ncbi:hypothetical protein RN001_014817 [Aquatica leii]|uniref:glutathione transferase n=1 Tax=Aquatica leii TaxID=1421715 RepID=A0AAN7SKS5_9COLE|nr:hypothetical protein RN001_014817 [Aquatica leii]
MCDSCGSCEACELKRSHKAINILDSDTSGDVVNKYKLTYFAIKAIAEPIRYLLNYGGIQFEDVRIKRDTWINHKPDMPFGQVPVLEVNGKKVHQSLAICRYLGKQLKINGNTDWEDLEIDSMADTINDLRAKIALYHYETDEEVKKSRKLPLYVETLPFYLERFEAIAKSNDGHLAIGKLTWVDFYFAGLIDYFNYMLEKNIIEDYPHLKEVINNVVGIPSVKEWIERRPLSEC